jgi:hypothetical protein
MKTPRTSAAVAALLLSPAVSATGNLLTPDKLEADITTRE